MKMRLGILLASAVLFATSPFSQQMRASGAQSTNLANGTETECAKIDAEHRAFRQRSDTNVVTVVMASDNNYAKYMRTAMRSMLKNAKDTTFYDFYLLVPPNFCEWHKNAISSLEKRYMCEVNFIDMGMVPFIKSHKNFPAAYYRLFAAKLLPNCDKCLYLDSDIVVKNDLSKLYGTNLGDCYVAGVRDFYVQLRRAFGEKYAASIGLPSIDQYVNSGILLMNLQLIKKDDLDAKFEQMLVDVADGRKSFPCHDQDVVNIACHGRIKFLEPKFNVLTILRKWAERSQKDRTLVEKFFGKKQLDKALVDPSIIHFAGAEKPWSNPWTYYAEQWRQYAPTHSWEPRTSRVRSKLSYYKCKALSKVTFGQTRAYYKAKCLRLQRKF
jgi:lipopolysaccharide biosynthesis glycosyltransferase